MSWDFDGVDDWVGNTTVAPVTGIPATVSFWFNPDTSSSTSLINICNASGQDGLRIIHLTSAGVRATSVVGGVGTAADSTTSVNVGSWNHVCAIFASTTSRTIYLNGGGQATNTVSSSPASFNRFHIGSRRINSVTDTFFNGLMAEIGIWNVALTADEVRSLNKGTSCRLIRPRSLVFYAPLIRQLLDYSKTNLSLSIFGSASVDSLQRHPRIYL